GQIVHPVQVGGDEDVGGSLLLDLLGKRRTSGEGQCHLPAGVLFVELGDFIQAVLHAGRRQHQGIVRRQHLGWELDQETQSGGGKCGFSKEPPVQKTCRNSHVRCPLD